MPCKDVHEPQYFVCADFFAAVLKHKRIPRQPSEHGTYLVWCELVQFAGRRLVYPEQAYTNAGSALFILFCGRMESISLSSMSFFAIFYRI